MINCSKTYEKSSLESPAVKFALLIIQNKFKLFTEEKHKKIYQTNSDNNSFQTIWSVDITELVIKKIQEKYFDRG